MSKPSIGPCRLPVRFMYALLALTMGCSATSGTRVEAPPNVGPDDGLNSTLWALTSAEYEATVQALYQAAERAVELGLTDPSWTALGEQKGQDGYSDLPPAVVLDVDETVLDNGAYQAGLILDGASYAFDTWLDWVLEERAGPIPGALAFTRHAAAMGVTVIYLTNRRGNMEEATRRNLIDLGFPVDSTFDVVLTRGERAEWSNGEKTSRRRYVGEHFRVLALVGDNLGDFLDIDGLNVDERNYAVQAERGLWGTQWFMLPNPQYGSWESALFDGRYDLTLSERRSRKRSRLEDLR